MKRLCFRRWLREHLLLILILASTAIVAISVTPSSSEARLKSIYAGDPDGTGNESPQPSAGSKSTSLSYGIQTHNLTREARMTPARTETPGGSWSWFRTFIELCLGQWLR